MLCNAAYHNLKLVNTIVIFVPQSLGSSCSASNLQNSLLFTTTPIAVQHEPKGQEQVQEVDDGAVQSVDSHHDGEWQ